MTFDLSQNPITAGLEVVSPQELADEIKMGVRLYQRVIYHPCTQTAALVDPELYRIKEPNTAYYDIAYIPAGLMGLRYLEQVQRPTQDFLLQLPGRTLDLWRLGDGLKKDIEDGCMKYIYLVKDCPDLAHLKGNEDDLPENIKRIQDPNFSEDHGAEPKQINERSGLVPEEDPLLRNENDEWDRPPGARDYPRKLQ